MKAILFTQYGSPDILQLAEVEKPTPKEDQVLVKIYAAAANPLDWHRMRGEPFLARLSEGYLKPNDPRLGADFAGRVEAVGADVTEFKPGDDVFGSVSAGGFAEYLCAEEKHLALKPAQSSFEEAASVPVVGFTAIQGFRHAGGIKPGHSVLVNGASGGIGTFAVQFARSYGAEVTGVCSARNFDLVRSLGAAHVVDYTREDFTRQTYDLIYDAVGNRSVSDYRRALNPQGTCVIAGFTSLSRLFEYMIVGSLTSRAEGKRVGLMPTANVDKQDLLLMKELLESGKVAPVIDKSYPLRETAEAIRYLETGRARGKVIVTVAQPD